MSLLINFWSSTFKFPLWTLSCDEVTKIEVMKGMISFLRVLWPRGRSDYIICYGLSLRSFIKSSPYKERDKGREGTQHHFQKFCRCAFCYLPHIYKAASSDCRETCKLSEYYKSFLEMSAKSFSTATVATVLIFFLKIQLSMQAPLNGKVFRLSILM